MFIKLIKILNFKLEWRNN